jgi:hypothetical protein
MTYGDPRGPNIIPFGRPNYRERVFIRDCIHAGEKFPVKKVQLDFARGVT